MWIIGNKCDVILHVDEIDSIERTGNKIFFYYHTHKNVIEFPSENEAKKTIARIKQMLEEETLKFGLE